MPIQIVGGSVTISGGTASFLDSSALITISNQTISDIASFGSANAWYILNLNGKVQQSLDIGYSNPTDLEQWCTPTNQASLYEARVTVSGAALDGASSATAIWLALSSSRQWGLVENTSGQSPVSTLTVDIRRIGTSTILDTATITLEATVL